MKECELQNIMNEVVYEIYESAYFNLISAHNFYKEYVDSNFERESSMSIANDLKQRAYEDISLISKFTDRDYKDLLSESPWPFNYDTEITRWWE